jgi:hypothetical protein
LVEVEEEVEEEVSERRRGEKKGRRVLFVSSRCCCSFVFVFGRPFRFSLCLYLRCSSPFPQLNSRDSTYPSQREREKQRQREHDEARERRHL